MSDTPPFLETIKQILDCHTKSFHVFLEDLENVFKHFQIESLSIISKEIYSENGEENYSVIASTKEYMVNERSFSNSKYKLFKLHEDFDLKLAIETKEVFANFELVEKLLQTKIDKIILEKKQTIRQNIIINSTIQKNMTTFSKKLLETIQSHTVFAQFITIYLFDDVKKQLKLLATTVDQNNIKMKLGDIYYSQEQAKELHRSFINQHPYIENEDTGFGPNGFESQLYNSKINNRAYWPIYLQSKAFDRVRNNPALKSIAIFEVINLQRKDEFNGEHTNRICNFSMYDKFILDFIAEVVFVLLLKYKQAELEVLDIAYVTHGLISGVAASIKNIDAVRKELFLDGLVPLFKRDPYAKFLLKEKDIAHLLLDSQHFLEDVENQLLSFNKIIRYSEPDVIDKFHVDVLMPVVHLDDSIAKNHNVKKPISIITSNSIDTPKLLGNIDGYKLVLRNLLENSIKYQKHDEPCKIEFKFSTDDKYFYIDYQDNGRGIASDEREDIFLHGYRSFEIRKISSKGLGFGLFHAREVMNAFHGSIVCIPSQKGARFKLTFKRA